LSETCFFLLFSESVFFKEVGKLELLSDLSTIEDLTEFDGCEPSLEMAKGDRSSFPAVQSHCHGVLFYDKEKPIMQACGWQKALFECGYPCFIQVSCLNSGQKQYNASKSFIEAYLTNPDKGITLLTHLTMSFDMFFLYLYTLPS